MYKTDVLENFHLNVSLLPVNDKSKFISLFLRGNKCDKDVITVQIQHFVIFDWREQSLKRLLAPKNYQS